MRFENGMLGVCISIVAIMGMVLSGFVLSVDAREVQTVSYDYVTDISGLFDYTDEPTFLDYNPSANWTGYYTDDPQVTDGIEYSTVDRANSYPIGQSSGVSATGTAELDDLGLAQLNPPVTGNSPPAYWRYGIIFDREPATTGMQSYDVPNPGVATIQTLIDALDLGDADSITFSLGSSQDSPIVIPNNSWTYREYTPPLSDTSHFWTASYYRDSSSAVTVSVDLESGVAIGYTASGSVAWRGAATTMCIVYGGEAASASTVQWNLSTSLSWTTYDTPAPVYMDISQGVSVSGTGPVNWTNGYINGGLDILFRTPNTGNSYSNTFIFELGDIFGNPSNDTITLQIRVAASGNVSITLTTGEGETSTLSMGNWRNFIVSIDTVNAEYTATPVTDFVSLTTFSRLNGSAQDIGLETSGRQTILGFHVSASNSLTFGVINTATFLNTYNAVMIDPHIDVSDYFTNLADVRLNFFSFALYGESVTINGGEYEMDGARVNIPDTSGSEPADRWLELTNVYITFEGADTYLTFNNDGLTIDLGETTTTEISFSGIWYFTTGLYSGHTETNTEYSWDYEDFAYSGNTAIVAFLGILAAGTVVGARFVKGGMGTLDYVVVAFAAICALALVIV